MFVATLLLMVSCVSVLSSQTIFFICYFSSSSEPTFVLFFSHEQLVEQPGFYRDLWAIQSGQNMEFQSSLADPLEADRRSDL